MALGRLKNYDSIQKYVLLMIYAPYYIQHILHHMKLISFYFYQIPTQRIIKFDLFIKIHSSLLFLNSKKNEMNDFICLIVICIFLSFDAFYAILLIHKQNKIKINTKIHSQNTHAIFLNCNPS